MYRFVFSCTFVIFRASAFVEGSVPTKPLTPREYDNALYLLNSMLTQAGLPRATRLLNGSKQYTTGVTYAVKYVDSVNETCTAFFYEDPRTRNVLPVGPGVTCQRGL